jgi:hypothetical protein
MLARRFLLSLLAVTAPALAGATDSSPSRVSLIVVDRWLNENIIGQPPCPDDTPADAQCISLNVIADVRLRARTLAGPDVPGTLTARFEFHALPASSHRQILLVRRSAADPQRFDALSLGRDQLGREICVDRSALSNNGVPVPRHARPQGDQVCFPPLL